MMKLIYLIVAKSRLLFVCVFVFCAAQMFSAGVPHLQFSSLTTSDGLPTNEVTRVFQDSEGFMWFATRYGLCKYDGYEVRVYKSNLNTPGLLTSNSITCVADDRKGNIWFGTANGMCALNKKTGKIKKYFLSKVKQNSICEVLVTRRGQIWIATDEGMALLDTTKDRFEILDGRQTRNILSSKSCKSIYEDRDGDIWIGTWDNGLFRYSPKEHRYYEYPRVNERNSVHVIWQDSDGKMWLGTWDCGLVRVDNPKDMKNVRFTTYRHDASNPASLSDNIIYSIVGDSLSGTMWVGTRSGWSIMSLDRPGEFTNSKQGLPMNSIPSDEVNSLCVGRSGMVWLGTIGGGVLLCDPRRPLFESHRLNFSAEEIPSTSVRSVFADSKRNIWIGVGSYGLARQDAKTGKLSFFSSIPEFSGIKEVPTINTILARRDGSIWFGTYNGGVLRYKEGEKVVSLEIEGFSSASDRCITALFEDSRKNCWIGSMGGLCVLFSDGRTYHFGRMSFGDGKGYLDWYNVKDIEEDSDGSVWIATANKGIIHIKGNLKQPDSLQFENFSYDNGCIASNSATCLLRDRANRLWAGTEGGGLYLYNRSSNRFETKNDEYKILGDIAASIEEDEKGCIWVGTNVGLVKIDVKSDSFADVRVYTTVDGLLDNFFLPRASCKCGNELIFGNNKGYNRFNPAVLSEVKADVPFYITDIKIFNRSLDSYPEKERMDMSPIQPTFSDCIRIPWKYNNFSIEFASLTYKDPARVRYAYKLEGFDHDWQYTDASRRFATYNNLNSGTYTFLLRASNENGIWSNDVKRMRVVILPPFYATWWAYCIYALLVAAAIWYVYRVGKRRIERENAQKLKEMERKKSDEVNAAKLQFFTNVTHELLTPLTIISATIDELKLRAPGYQDLYSVAGHNISKLIRLLRQILEFRKADTGNLKLRVSEGDIARFVSEEAESFRPLLAKKSIQLNVVCSPTQIEGYFDTDKLDKILYNLLSNAAKYNQGGGHIDVSVSLMAQRGCRWVEIRVKDDGPGISKEKQMNLFKRFYEGDYRKFKTEGTGIGLSLTRDLVQLHKGAISVESEEGKGAEFIVQFPIDRSEYAEEQIDDTSASPLAADRVKYEASGMPSAEEVENQEALENAPTVLIVEDNDELRNLMFRLLKRDYNVLTASNGVKALDVLSGKEVDLVVSDIMMPEMDGIALCRHIKGELELSHIPVILLTAKNKDEDRAEAYEVGADAFISKPFNLQVLHARIRNLLKYRENIASKFKNQLVFEMKDMDYTSIDEDFLQRAIDCVNRHLDDGEFDQQQFVDEMGTSKSTLYKKLKSLTGLNTSAFIRNIRMKAASRIMEEKGMSLRISELAYSVGFNDPKYFSSCFKKDFGMLPTEYLEQLAAKKGTASGL